jgi:hypothetical protein
MSAELAQPIDLTAATDRILTFVAGLDIPVREGPVPGDAFLPGVRIADGGLTVDRTALFTPGDLLHEAGHLAVVPRRYRDRIGDDVDAGVAAVRAEAAAAGDHDTVLDGLEGLGGELQAIAWSYAACRHLGLPLEIVFKPGAYGTDKNAGTDPMAIAQQIEMGFFPGLHRLIRAGMTAPPQCVLFPDAPPGGFPAMRCWVQP